MFREIGIAVLLVAVSGGLRAQDAGAQNPAQQRASDLSVLKEHQPPVDLLPGELDLTNLHGVGVTLLRHLASLQAGDLARVECHLLDDLVRIVAQNFRHHSAIGDPSAPQPCWHVSRSEMMYGTQDETRRPTGSSPGQ